MNFKNESEIKKYVYDTYKYKIELHAHTSPVSLCADIEADEVVRRYAELGYDAIVITNHFSYQYRNRFEKEPTAEEFVDWYLSDYNKAVEAGKKYGIVVILGAEFCFNNGEIRNDYLAFGLDRELLIESFYRIPYTIETYKENEKLKDVLIIQAHRFRDNMTEIDPKFIDGLETFNMHIKHNSRNAKAVMFAKENNLNIVTVGSDYHHSGGEGITALLTKTLPKNSFELKELLKTRDYVFEIGQDAVVLP